MPFFLLSKDRDRPVDDPSDCRILQPGPRRTWLLPANHLDYHARHGLFEASLIEWSRQFCRKDALFLDVGAHTGSYAVSLASSARKVYAFEPQRMTCYALCGSVALSDAENIECLPFGLGSPDQVGLRELAIVSEDGGGSSLHPASQALRTETVEIRTLDSLGLEEPISLVKLDVEGNELQVLQGGVETLERCGRPTLLLESNRENPELLDFLDRVLDYRAVPISGYPNMLLGVPK